MPQNCRVIGLSLIDKVLAGLPDNARLRADGEKLRTQVAELEQENARLKSENTELKARLVALEKETEENPEQFRVLQLFFQRDELTSEQVSQELGIDVANTNYHIGELRQRELVLPSRHRVVGRNIQINYYKITQAGRQVIVDNGLN